MGISSRLMDILIDDAKKKRFPITVNFELLPVCNLDCKMCYIKSSFEDVQRCGGLLAASKWLEIAKELQEAGTMFILLTGGEVFLYPDFKYLYEQLILMGFSICINTNGTMIDENVVEWLRQYPPRNISLSLYGTSNETYEALCGAKGMFDRVDKAITLLQEAGIRIECKTILNPINEKDMFYCKEYCKERNIPWEMAVYAYPPARKLRLGKNVRFTPQEAIDCQIKYNSTVLSKEKHLEIIKKDLDKYNQMKNKPGTVKCGLTCSATNSSCWINWQGHMISCTMIHSPKTYPFEVGFMKAWEELKEKLDQMKLSESCALCDKRSVCIVCPASCFTETGKVNGKPSYLCEMTEYKLKRYNEIIEEENL